MRSYFTIVAASGRNLPCGAQLPGHPQRVLLNEIVDGHQMGYAIGLARMRLDGFASLDGHESDGTVTTKPLRFTHYGDGWDQFGRRMDHYRAEVGLLSRSIVIQGDDNTKKEKENEWHKC